MADRGNILIKQNGLEVEGNGSSACPYLYLYTNYQGVNIPAVLQEALMRSPDVWADESYLARVIFCELLRYDGDDLRETLDDNNGLGISVRSRTADHDLLVVDAKTRHVWRAKNDTPDRPLSKNHIWSFDKFCTLDAKTFIDF